MRKVFLFVIVAVFVSMLGFCAYAQEDQAYDFEAQDIYGNKFNLSDHQGKVIFLNFFATWCPPCRMEMPDFNRLMEMYPDQAVVIAVNVGNEPLEKVKQFTQANDIKFTVCQDTQGLAELYGPIRAIPVTVVIDKNFIVVDRYIGARPLSVFEKDVRNYQ